MFIELADERVKFSFNSLSVKACFTNLWQSSKFPSTSIAVMFLSKVVSCFSCIALTLPKGKAV